ncbi:ATP-binding protein [Streptomyces violaceus]|uniref:ATP-binding protein n=1 Tax=Streptomyces violaceus TaxID=1936 RepID=UPI002E2A84AA|nr:ATP-binding protein [Streptomyces violaceus]
MNGVPRELLATWPSRFHFPDVLIALAERGPDGAQPPAGPAPELDAGVLADAVLAHVGGLPPRATFDTLLDRGEHDAAEQLLKACPDLREHDGGLPERRLESARARSAEVVRQRITALTRRAEAAGVPVAELDPVVLAERVRSRLAAADEVLCPLERDLDRQVEGLAAELEEIIARQEREAAGPAASAEQPAPEGLATERVRSLLAAGELVSARALLNREPIGVPVPEAVTPLPMWDGNWTEETLLEYHLNRAVRRPPEFLAWQAADDDAKELLAAFDSLSRQPSAEAAEDFANALGRFLGAPGEEAVARRIEGGWFTFFDGLFDSDLFTGLRPTGRVDLYVADPETTVVQPALAADGPVVAVGPGLVVTGYTDRQAVAVLSLRDLLRMAVLRADRAAALLGVLARQWPVEVLIGDTRAALDKILGEAPDTAWRTLRWITRLSLGGDASAVQVMENCTGMDPGLLWVMLRHAQGMDRRASRDGLWTARSGGWRKDETLLHAMRAELLARCGEPAAQAAWWAALAVCDRNGGVSRGDVADWAEVCSTWPAARERAITGIRALEARGLLLPAQDAAEPGSGFAAADENGATRFRVPLSGAVRALIPTAERELTTLLEEMERAEKPHPGEPVAAEGAEDGATAISAWTAWHRNRFAPVPSYAAYIEAEGRGAGADELAALAALADRELREDSAEELIARAVPEATDLSRVMAALAAECQGQYGTVRLDLRCPASLWVDVPEPVLRAVLYEVWDNAAEEVADRGDGMVQVVVTLDSPEVLVRVQDNGPGLPTGARARRIFQPEWTTRGAARGWGLPRVRRFLRSLTATAVEADVEVLSSSHPALTGAALQLILPERETGSHAAP